MCLDFRKQTQQSIWTICYVLLELQRWLNDNNKLVYWKKYSDIPIIVLVAASFNVFCELKTKHFGVFAG